MPGVFDEEKRSSGSFQKLPFYYLELAQTLFRECPTDTFGAEGFGKVKDCPGPDRVAHVALVP